MTCIVMRCSCKAKLCCKMCNGDIAQYFDKALCRHHLDLNGRVVQGIADFENHLIS